MGIPLSHPPRFIRRRRSNSSRRPRNSTPSVISFENEISQFYGGSSVLDAFRYIEGRRYHNSDVQYCFPNDNEELKRMQLSHNVFKYSWGDTNFSAPVTEMLSAGGVHVFDVGCGPGTWCLEMSREYPRATFIGVDISPTFSLNDKPPNVGYLQCDALEGLPFPSETFHYCWQKFMVSSFTKSQWIKHIKEMARVTKHGGWVELMEVNVEFFNVGPALTKLSTGCRRYYVAKNLLPLISHHVVQFMEETGEFGDIVSEERPTNLGAWAGEQGEKAVLNLVQAYQALKPVVRPTLGIGEYEYDELVNSLKRETASYRTYMKSYRYYAQRRSKHLNTPY